MSIRCKRIYEAASPDDGARILVDRLWPRGFSKSKAGLDDWMMSVAPSHALRQRFGHDARQWDEFVMAYRLELATVEAQDQLATLRAMARNGMLTLLYAARDQTHNNAVALKSIIEDG